MGKLGKASLTRADYATRLVEELETRTSRADAAGAASITLAEKTSNGVHTFTIAAPAAITANRTLTLPDHDVYLTKTPVAWGTANAITLTAAEHAGRVLTIGELDGTALTMPAATGTGNVYRIVVQQSPTSVGDTITVAGTMCGTAFGIDTDTTDYAEGYETAADTNTITLNVTTSGGVSRGGYWELTDIAADIWAVQGYFIASGNLTTPFSAV